MSWNSRGIKLTHSHDQVCRLIETKMSDSGAADVVVARTVYGESQSDAQFRNLRGRVYQIYDQSGVLTSDLYDFKGNCLQTSRQLCLEYKNVVDWSSSDQDMEPQVYTGSTMYNALNKVIQQIEFDNSKIRYDYNLAGLLSEVYVNIKDAKQTDGSLLWIPYLTGMTYGASGEKLVFSYANGVTTTLSYDPLTKRRTQMLTKRQARTLQNSIFTYDPVGNIMRIEDQAQQSIYFRDNRIDPVVEYTYNAISRLITATGREHLGLTNGQPSAPEPYSPTKNWGTGTDSPTDGKAMGKYTESYTYDLAGNIMSVKHEINDAKYNGWTRTYNYTEPSFIDPSVYSNRLTSTQVGNLIDIYKYNGSGGATGNMTSMPHLKTIDWDYRDILHSTVQQIVNIPNATPETCWYTYSGQDSRMRKIVERQASPGQAPTHMKETIYNGQFEIFREYDNTGQAIIFERHTLHIVGGTDKIADLETRVIGDEPGVPIQLIRFQICNNRKAVSVKVDEEGGLISYEEYSPYGATTYQATKVRKKYRFAGKELDTETGLYFVGARYYAAWLGRWVSPDPGSVTDSLNFYSYVAGNPTGFVDFSGGELSSELEGTYVGRAASWLMGKAEGYPVVRGMIAGTTNAVGGIFTTKGAAIAGVAIGLTLLGPEVAAVVTVVGAGMAIYQGGKALVAAAHDIPEVIRNPSNENIEKMVTHGTEAVANGLMIVTMNGGLKGGGGNIAKSASTASRALGLTDAAAKLGGGLAGATEAVSGMKPSAVGAADGVSTGDTAVKASELGGEGPLQAKNMKGGEGGTGPTKGGGSGGPSPKSPPAVRKQAIVTGQLKAMAQNVTSMHESKAGNGAIKLFRHHIASQELKAKFDAYGIDIHKFILDLGHILHNLEHGKLVPEGFAREDINKVWARVISMMESEGKLGGNLPLEESTANLLAKMKEIVKDRGFDWADVRESTARERYRFERAAREKAEAKLAAARGK